MGNYTNIAPEEPYNTDNTMRLEILVVIIHQIFSLARDWSKHVTWANIPQLKLRGISEDIPQFSKLRALRKRFEG